MNYLNAGEIEQKHKLFWQRNWLMASNFINAAPKKMLAWIFIIRGKL